MNNYLEVKRAFPLFYRHFIFFDDNNYSANSLLFRNKVHIKLCTALGKDDEKYRIIFCNVRSRDVPLFIRAMEELKNKMLLIGNLDYEAFCDRLMPVLEE